MRNEIITESDMKVQKRNGQIVNFNSHRVNKAIGNAFKELRNLPREADLPLEDSETVDKIAERIFSVLHECLR